MAGSTLKFNWGATNHVAGVCDWRNTLTKAMKDLKAFPSGHVLHLRLEDAHNDLEKFASQLDNFVQENFAECRQEILKQDLEHSLGSVKSYPVNGIQGLMVKKLAPNLNYRLGYVNTSLPSWQENVYRLAALPFLLIDRIIRIVRVLKRKFMSQ